MQKTTRQKILDYLERRGPVAAVEISRSLALTPANIRHHLGSLQNEGVVVVAGTLPVEGRGRPTLLYTTSAQAGAHNLDGLASTLLTAHIQSLETDSQEQAIASLAKTMLQGGKPPVANLTRRLTAAIAWLNQHGYQARWEAHSGAPRVILGHCPYAAIIGQHPELCRLDAALLSDLLSVNVNQVEKLQTDAGGLPRCLFQAG